MKIFNIIEQALKYIDNNLNEQIGYERLANIFHFSPYYFHRMFTIITGKTITAYIRDRRLEQSCVMLSGTKKATLEICLDCGFDAYSSFNRIFKNKYGLSPKEYRKQCCTPVIISVDELIKTFKENLEGGNMNEKLMNEIEELNKKIEIEPDNWELFNVRGHLYYDLDDYENSAADGTRAIELNPTTAENFFHRGTSYHNLGKYVESVADCTKAIELNPENPQYYFGRGISYRYLGEYKKAVEDFTKGIELDPTETAYDYCERGRAYHYMDESEKARVDFIKAVELDPGIITKYEDVMIHYGIKKS